MWPGRTQARVRLDRKEATLTSGARLVVKGGGGRRTRPGKGSEPELGRAREGKREGKERKKGKKEVGRAKREKGEKRMFSIFLKWIQTNSN